MLFFNGRPDGLGNRIEEIILIEAYCILNNKKCEYYWNNIYNHRKYDHHIISQNISIQSHTKYLKSDFSISAYDFSKDQIQNAVKNINITIKLPKINMSYISIHIRSTDKLLNRNKDEFTQKVFEEKFEKTINIINSMNNEKIIICADDLKWKKIFINKINDKNKILDIYDNIDIDPVYKDFMILMNSKAIYMIPKFSSFAATASLLGNNILYSHFRENETNLSRYKCNVNLL